MKRLLVWPIIVKNSKVIFLIRWELLHHHLHPLSVMLSVLDWSLMLVHWPSWQNILHLPSRFWVLKRLFSELSRPEEILQSMVSCSTQLSSDVPPPKTRVRISKPNSGVQRLDDHFVRRPRGHVQAYTLEATFITSLFRSNFSIFGQQVYHCIKNRCFLRNSQYNFWRKVERSSWRKIEVVWKRNSSKEEFGCYEGGYCCRQCCQWSRKCIFIYSHGRTVSIWFLRSYLGWKEKGRR